MARFDEIGSWNDYLAIITAYLPSDQEWESDYRKRKKQ